MMFLYKLLYWWNLKKEIGRYRVDLGLLVKYDVDLSMELTALMAKDTEQTKLRDELLNSISGETKEAMHERKAKRVKLEQQLTENKRKAKSLLDSKKEYQNKIDRIPHIIKELELRSKDLWGIK